MCPILYKVGTYQNILFIYPVKIEVEYPFNLYI